MDQISWENIDKPLITKIVRVMFVIGCFLATIFCIWAIRDGWFPSDAVLRRHPDPSDTFYLFNKSFAIVRSGLKV
jgi:hypothetical protein